MDILQVSNVSKSFGTNQVINNLSFSVKQNQIYGFLGQNGVGKTTVMKMILGLHTIDGGSITVNGQQVTFGQTKTNQYIGYLADVPAFYDFMTATEYLNLCGKISKIEKQELQTRISEMLNLVGLADNKVRIGGYSRGMRQRLGIAQALLGKPLLLICDEPTSALDPIGRIQILDILKQAAATTTVIFSTHILSDVERICDHVGILHHGKLALDIDINTLTTKYPNPKIIVEFSNNTDLQTFTNNHTCSTTLINETALELEQVELAKLYQALHNLQVYPLRIEVVKPTLESVFLEVTNV